MAVTTKEDIRQALRCAAVTVSEALRRRVASYAGACPRLAEAMRYSLQAGGKRLRPVLVLWSCEMCGGNAAEAMPAAMAVECVHTFSLIHDDLPALDNDDLRRGKPSCHRVFGEATAILAGDALLTLAFEIISEPGAGIEERRLEVIHDLSHAIGTRAGMVGGQVVDLETAGHTTSAETLDYIHSAKTGSFIRAAVRSGALDAGANPEDLGRLSAYGGRIGLAFQIADDLLDVTSTREELGKSVGKDDQQHKATYPAIHGIEESRRIAVQLVHEACQALEPYGDRARRLQELAHFLIERTH